jgi:hypothetical protein
MDMIGKRVEKQEYPYDSFEYNGRQYAISIGSWDRVLKHIVSLSDNVESKFYMTPSAIETEPFKFAHTEYSYPMKAKVQYNPAIPAQDMNMLLSLVSVQHVPERR